MLIHSGNKPYICEICKNRFTHPSNLKRHALVPTGEKPNSLHVRQSSDKLEISHIHVIYVINILGRLEFLRDMR